MIPCQQETIHAARVRTATLLNKRRNKRLHQRWSFVLCTATSPQAPHVQSNICESDTCTCGCPIAPHLAISNFEQVPPPDTTLLALVIPCTRPHSYRTNTATQTRVATSEHLSASPATLPTPAARAAGAVASQSAPTLETQYGGGDLADASQNPGWFGVNTALRQTMPRPLHEGVGGSSGGSNNDNTDDDEDYVGSSDVDSDASDDNDKAAKYSRRQDGGRGGARSGTRGRACASRDESRRKRIYMSLDDHKTLMEYVAQARELMRAKADILRNPESLQYRRYCDWYGSPSLGKIWSSDEVRGYTHKRVFYSRASISCARTARITLSCGLALLLSSALQAARQMLLKKDAAFADKFNLLKKKKYDKYVKSCKDKFKKLKANQKRTGGGNFYVDEELYQLFERAFGPEDEFLSKSFLYIPPPAFLLRSEGGTVANSGMNSGVSNASSGAVTSTVLASGGGVEAIRNVLTADSARAPTSSRVPSSHSRPSSAESSRPPSSAVSPAMDAENNSAMVASIRETPLAKRRRTRVGQQRLNEVAAVLEGAMTKAAATAAETVAKAVASIGERLLEQRARMYNNSLGFAAGPYLTPPVYHGASMQVPYLAPSMPNSLPAGSATALPLLQSARGLLPMPRAAAPLSATPVPLPTPIHAPVASRVGSALGARASLGVSSSDAQHFGGQLSAYTLPAGSGSHVMPPLFTGPGPQTSALIVPLRADRSIGLQGTASASSTSAASSTTAAAPGNAPRTAPIAAPSSALLSHVSNVGVTANILPQAAV